MVYEPRQMANHRSTFLEGMVSVLEIQPETSSLKFPGRVKRRSWKRRSPEQDLEQIKKSWEQVGEYLCQAVMTFEGDK